MKKKLVIFGNNILAKIAYFYFNRDSNYEVVAFTVNQNYISEKKFCNKDVISFENIEIHYSVNDIEFFVAIGPSRINVLREEKFNEIKNKGYKIASYISPKSICQSKIGENVFVGDFVAINPFVSIGNNIFFWEYTYIGNDSIIEDNCYFSPKSSIGTFSCIKKNSIIGSGAIINTKVTIAEKTLVGASCYISQDTKYKGVYGKKTDQLLGCISDKINIS